jgi:predicted acylesterase/phospholipase RssA
MGHTLKEITEILDTLYHKTAYLDVIRDITFPFLSILSGKVFKKKLVSTFEDKQIEDLRIPFFSVSTNMSKFKQMIHDSGSLWFANRASSGVPLIVPPVVSKFGLLIDGSFINNVPTDVMNNLGANILIRQF